jgi:nucleotide-binding universal stress UspA family protein
MTIAIVAALVAVAVALVLVALAFRRRRPALHRGAERILIPFTGGALDPAVLGAGIRIARAEEATLVPAYLIVVPREQPQDAAMQQEVAMAMPLLEAVEHAALRAGVPVDARIETGRTPVHALQRLWESENFDRVVVPARGFTPKDLTWVLTHAPSETVILRPAA